MRILAVDLGARRIGLAMSDPSGSMALPQGTLETRELESGLASRIAEHGVERLVVGLPLEMDGTEGTQATAARRIGAQLERTLGVPVDYWDERLSSVAANREMAAGGMDSRRRRGRVDPVAACLFLQSYLDRQAGAKT